jgi:wobble nucleotide-excising tRNase
LPLDETLIDIINKASISVLRYLPEETKKILDVIEKIIGGKVLYKNDSYYIVRNGIEYNFQVESEGFKKFAVLSRLIETGVLVKNAILFWDEPEANMNPANIPVLVDILFELQRMGVQIFAATHDYLFAKYLEIRKEVESKLLFHALYQDKTGKGIQAESNTNFTLLNNNAITEQTVKLYEEAVRRAMD